MRADLRKKLDAIFANSENEDVTGVTGVTSGISRRNLPELLPVTDVTAAALENGTHVTRNPVTYENTNGYNGYDSYASKPAIRQIAKQGDGAELPDPSEIAERVAIIVEGDGCSDAETEQRALGSVGLAHSQMLADGWRRQVSNALTFAPLPCTAEGRHLFILSRKFLESPWFHEAVHLGWDMVSLFGIAADPMTAGKADMSLVVWLALNPSRAKLEKLTADCAQARKPCGKFESYCRFHFLINDEATLWWHSDRIFGEAAA